MAHNFSCVTKTTVVIKSLFRQSGEMELNGSRKWDKREGDDLHREDTSKGVKNAQNLRTNSTDFAEREGEGVPKFQDSVDVIFGSPLRDYVLSNRVERVFCGHVFSRCIYVFGWVGPGRVHALSHPYWLKAMKVWNEFSLLHMCKSSE